MARIAVIIDDMYEDSEYAEPAKAFEQAGHELVHIGLEGKKQVKGKKGQSTVNIDMSVNHAQVDHFDALLIPGGYSPDHLRVDNQAVLFTRAFFDSGKPVFAICHAAQLLVTAQVLEGRTLTCYQSVIQDVKNAGANYVDREVVIDRNLISSRTPNDLPAFIKASLQALEQASGGISQAA